MTSPGTDPSQLWTAPDETRALSMQQAAPQESYVDLVAPDDPDWTAFQAQDPNWFLRAAGRAIRKYCGWHLYPNLRETLTNAPQGSWGIIMLPSRYVTAVDNVFLNRGDDEYMLVDPTTYIWDKSGWIQRTTTAYWDWYSQGYYFGNDQYYLPNWDIGAGVGGGATTQVTFWHGYATCPEDIKEVAFELAQQTMTSPSGNVKDLATAGGYRLSLSQDFGMTLNKDQMNRLANYRVGMIG